MPKAQNPYIKINPLRVCPYDPCILPTIVMPLSTWFIAAILWVKSIPQSVYRNESSVV
jgi:hypothetical protein